MKRFTSISIIPLIILMSVFAVASDIDDNMKANKVTINIESDPPGVRLSVNDIDVGETPQTLIYFEPGRYKITGKLNGYKNVKREIDVAAGETANLEFVMEERKPGVPAISWVVIGLFGAAFAFAIILELLENAFAGD